MKISKYALANYKEAWVRSNMGRLLFNSLFVALVSTAGKIVMAILSAFAIVFFDFRFKSVAFWTIFITLMLGLMYDSANHPILTSAQFGTGFILSY